MMSMIMLVTKLLISLLEIMILIQWILWVSKMSNTKLLSQLVTRYKMHQVV